MSKKVWQGANAADKPTIDEKKILALTEADIRLRYAQICAQKGSQPEMLDLIRPPGGLQTLDELHCQFVHHLDELDKIMKDWMPPKDIIDPSKKQITSAKREQVARTVYLWMAEMKSWQFVFEDSLKHCALPDDEQCMVKGLLPDYGDWGCRMMMRAQLYDASGRAGFLRALEDSLVEMMQMGQSFSKLSSLLVKRIQKLNSDLDTSDSELVNARERIQVLQAEIERLETANATILSTCVANLPQIT